MGSRRTIVIVIHYEIMMEKSRMIVHDDEVVVRVTQKRYDRMKASFESKKFAKMNDDADLADILPAFEKDAKTADNQIILFDYPDMIQKGKTFEDIDKIQNRKLSQKEIDDEIKERIDEESEKEKTFLDEYLEHIEDMDVAAINEAVDELIRWLHDRGLDQGEEGFSFDDMNTGFYDLAWPEGMLRLRREYSKPMALCLTYSSPEFTEIARSRGFICFTSVQELKDYVEKTFHV